MRIGINASFLRKPGTGIGQVTFNFLEKLKESSINNEQSTFVLYTEEPVAMELPENFTVRTFLPFWKRDDLVRKWLWEKKVVTEAKKDRCDAFVSLYQATTVFPETFQHTMVAHDIIPRLFSAYQGNRRQKWYWKGVERALLRASRLVAVSEATKNDLVEFGIPRERVTVAYPDTAPIFLVKPTTEVSQQVLRKYGLEPGYMYHGGGLEIRKNGERLLRAYKVVLEKSVTSGLVVPPLVISGRIFSAHNPLATPVQSIVDELGLKEQVRLLDFVPEADLPVLYEQALFFIYPSLYEGFGLPVLEALRMGTPVVTSDVASLPEVALNSALYIDPENVSSIASGMERLIVDASLRETLKHAPEEDLARFDWSRFVRAVLPPQ
ncbi:MAG: glycosyltransferase family 4 protein [Candidatus Moranbacteria bacterium]|nr:glycosyltransferase family 4 protein [Candidatus Moranbacteria bacterium]